MPLDIAVDGAGKGRAKAHKVGSAFLGADIVGESEDVFLVAGVVLQGKIHSDIVHDAFTEDN